MLLYPAYSTFRQNRPSLQFFPENSAFSWEDKLGTYRFFNRQGKDYLEFSFNYAREETYLFTILEKEGETVSAFRLHDRWGKETDFRKMQE
ncbi:hypothetical protein ACFOTA_01300 [Chitinophaga sp. GCM10012297]|uniref:Uncharacterized protein n=1 Tax=Chitinophaga chungangae TaxID=2821488 RepID=A0ABS3Y827_9BACT|nr:hypothetical protein [Chitinophaga chungangae]MBO9150828.1 hypothetical protein [Chitinophaga chungangae]